MPVVTSCPDCSRKLRVPDELLGKKVRCPGCKVVFTARSEPAEEREEAPPPPRRSAPPREERIEEQPRSRRPPPPPEDEDDDRPRGRQEEEQFTEDQEEEQPRGRRLHEDDEYGEGTPGSRADRTAWQKVARGIQFVLIYLGSLVVLTLCGGIGGGIVGGVTAASVAASRAPGGAPGATAAAVTGGTGFFLLALVMGLLGVGAKCLDLYGHYLGMAVPDKPGTGLRGLAVTTFGLNAAAVGLSIIATIFSLAFGITGGFFMSPFGGTGAMIAVSGLNLIGNLCYLAGFITFILYLRAVAMAVKRKDLGKQLRAYLITMVSLTVVSILLFGLALAVVGASAFSGFGGGAPPSPGAANAMAGGFIAVAVLGCLGGVVGLGLSIWYVILLVQVRRAVLNFARRG
jgi:hypothetical protein